MAKEGGKKRGKKECILHEDFLETFWRYWWSPGEILDLFDSSYFPLRLHVYTHLGSREGNNTLPKELWLSSQSPGPNRAATPGKQIGFALPRWPRAVWLFRVFSPCIFLFAACIFPVHREAQLPHPQVHLDPEGCCLLPFSSVASIISPW